MGDLATLLYHALQCEELYKLTVKDFRHERRGAAHWKVSGKGSKTQYVPLHPAAHKLIVDHFEAAGRGLEVMGVLFRAVGNRAGGVARVITADAIYKIVRGDSAELGLGHANIATTRIHDHDKTREKVSPTFKVAY